MDEAQWLRCRYPSYMLIRARSRLSRRQRLLFAVACCRRLERLFPAELFQHAVELVERHADGQCSATAISGMYGILQAAGVAAVDELRARWGRAAAEAWVGSLVGRRTSLPETTLAHEEERLRAPASAVICLSDAELFDSTPLRAAEAVAAFAGESQAARQSAQYQERKSQAALLREIVGNPFRPARFDPFWLAWNGGTIVHLTQAIYDERAFDRMPILADALEDAGCHAADILDHCRGGGEHVRGCWVVDLLLGKN